MEGRGNNSSSGGEQSPSAGDKEGKKFVREPSKSKSSRLPSQVKGGEKTEAEGKHIDDLLDPAYTHRYECADKDATEVLVAQDPLGSLRGGIGATVWDSALVLCRYLEHQKICFQSGCSVLDIGSGTGIVGLVLACSQKRCRVTLSDHPRTIPLLAKNAEMNRKIWESKDSKVKIEALDWCDDSPDAAATIQKWKNERFDIICASDVVIWPELYDPLIRVLSSLLERGGLSVYLSYEQRKKSNEKEFFQKLSRKVPGVSIAKIKAKDLHPDYQSSELHLYLIGSRPTDEKNSDKKTE
eukprot:jgi/Bigna1/52400/estExt_Genewise1Plus.C_70247